MTKILVATRSKGKQREIRALSEGAQIEFVFPDEIGLMERPEEATIETESSFEGNARRKAEYFVQLSRLPTAAEDSGIEVFSLGGAPGVRSRRFTIAEAADQDRANNEELLRRLAGAPPNLRGARYQSVIVFLPRRDAVPHTFSGMVRGRIADQPTGDGGFGYDPLFYCDELGMTFGEASPEAKHAVSHRGRSFGEFLEWVRRHPGSVRSD